MRYGLLKITPFACVLSLQDIKLHSRIDVDDDDPLLGIFLNAVQDWTEGVTGRPLGGACQYKMTIDAYPDIDSEFTLPRSPLISLDSIKYVDLDTGNQLTQDPTTYRAPIDGRDLPRVAPEYLQIWPRIRNVIGAVEVTFTAGFTDDSNPVISALKVIMLKMASNWYEYREAISTGMSVAELPGAAGFRAILQPYIIPSFGG